MGVLVFLLQNTLCIDQSFVTADQAFSYRNAAQNMLFFSRGIILGVARRAFGRRRGKRKVRERCRKGEDKCYSINH